MADQITAVFDVPSTVAVNAWVWLGPRVAVEGVIVMLTGGVSVTVANALFVGSAALAAITVTVCWAKIVAGAI